MSYQVLARKWRPRNFHEMVGQEHVLRALVNSLDRDRLHHAYLFTGTRGVGKTTIARILAKSLNCETAGVSSQPCGECSACREIDEGRFVDLIEVDAASRTKVEDTRELLENVQYAPTRGRYKVYLIDEVHMLSTHSFNALLKTLEEPPPHVKFLLATTDPQRLPVTILSRCLQFNLKRLPLALISEYLGRIIEHEQLEAEPAALQQLARAADGSMRDALSLLDQAIAYGGGAVREPEVRAMLGTIEQDHVVGLLRALAAGDARALLDGVAHLAEQVPDFGTVLADLLSTLQRVAVAQTLPEAVDDTLGDRQVVMELAQQLSPEDTQLFYQIGLIGRRDLPLAPDGRGGLEMVLLRMLAFRPADAGAGGEVRTTAPTGRPASVTPARPAVSEAPVDGRAGRAAASQPPPGEPAPQPEPGAAPPPAATPPRSEQDGAWPTLIDKLGLKGMVRELAANCALRDHDGDRIELVLDASVVQLRSDALEQRLRQALAQHYGRDIRLVIEAGDPHSETPAREQARREQERQVAAVEAIEGDSNVRALQETFDARIQTDSIHPID
ncbi:MAG TPA: DNA polymerase III subunit gamma/tau [Gammaproteobacteria bacterium]|nr:DNA polymerase III subunit gamma/tau [Gammaproteobacteria bacterium]